MSMLVRRLARSNIVATLAALLAGCQAVPAPPAGDAGASGRITLNDGDPGEVAPPTAADGLARQAEQDVAEFLRRRAEASGTAPADPVFEPGPGPTRRGARDEGQLGLVLWRDAWPDDGAPPADHVAATDGPGEFRPGPLFRDPLSLDPTAIVTAPGADSAEPAVPVSADRVHELIVQLSGELYRDAAYDDVPLRELLLIAALTLADPDRALEPDAIPGLTEREREILVRFQSFFAALGRDLDGSRDVEEVIGGHVSELRRGLLREPELKLPTATLCTRVGGFGDFDAYRRAGEDGGFVFLAHAERKAIVYLELNGFTSTLNERSEWVTELSQQLVIYSDRDGIPVWKRDWEPVVDRTRHKRTDFFTVQIITLPKALSVGRYHLKVRVRDEQSSAETEAGIPLEMVADPKMISGG